MVHNAHLNLAEPGGYARFWLLLIFVFCMLYVYAKSKLPYLEVMRVDPSFDSYTPFTWAFMKKGIFSFSILENDSVYIMSTSEARVFQISLLWLEILKVTEFQ